jgi:hypothetical protein
MTSRAFVEAAKLAADCTQQNVAAMLTGVM